MRILIAFLAVGLTLAGCTTISNIDSAIQANVGKICSGAQQSHTIFVAASASTLVPQKYIDREASAYSTISALCANPASINTVTLTAAVAAHIAAMKAAKQGA